MGASQQASPRSAAAAADMIIPGSTVPGTKRTLTVLLALAAVAAILHEDDGDNRLEELLNVATHGLGCAFALRSSFYLLRQSESHGAAATWSCALYSATLVACFGSSAVYHACHANPLAFALLQRFDHAGIYLLIAGSYTPMLGLGFTANDRGCRFVVFLEWVVAVVGCTCSALGLGLSLDDSVNHLELGVFCLMGLGFLPVVAAVSASFSTEALKLLLAGGAAYLVGIAFFTNPKPIFHVVWHLFVLTGAALHFLCIKLHVLPAHPRIVRRSA